MTIDLTTAFEQYLKQLISPSKAAMATVLQQTEVKTLKKRMLFLAAGKTCNEIAFFTKGYFRFYYFNKNADEITLNFHFAPGFITSYTSFIQKQPSHLFVQAMDKTEILVIKRTLLFNLMEQYPEFMKLGKIMADKVALDAEEHLYNLLNCTAEERYASLLKLHPEYVQHIPLQYIASYLGVSPETLSRIRRKVR